MCDIGCDRIVRERVVPSERCPVVHLPTFTGHRFGEPHKVPGELSCRLQMEGGITSALDLLVLADAMQPTAAGLGVPGWFPTVELTVYVRAVPADGWLIGRHRTQELIDGWFDEEAELWDSRGRLVCQARQLAGYRLR